jgi:hypothetical protein
LSRVGNGPAFFVPFFWHPLNEKDLIFIILNHGLNVIDQLFDKVDSGDVLEDFKKYRDASDYMFNLSEVKNIEANLKVDGKIPHAETK